MAIHKRVKDLSKADMPGRFAISALTQKRRLAGCVTPVPSSVLS